jgi:xylulokinase
VLEGVAFGMRDMLGLMREAGLPRPERARISGGGARGPLWRAIVASALGISLDLPASTEGAAYGAALLAGVGADVWPDVDAAASAIAVTPTAEPDPADAARYDALYARYSTLYATLAPAFHDLARIAEG